MQGNLKLDIVLGSGVGHGTPNFDALSERSNYSRDSHSTVAGPPSCASVALRRMLIPRYMVIQLPRYKFQGQVWVTVHQILMPYQNAAITEEILKAL